MRNAERGMQNGESVIPNPQSPIPNRQSPIPNPKDVAGARRARRSFRFCVTACVLLAVMLWLSERYLRFELTESQYIAALTLPTESARAILRSVVKRDAAQHESPTPKYLEALAEREEEDNILPTYEKAYKLDPSNEFLVLRYGCALFAAGRYAEARNRFREAALLPTENALPKYLEAAALAFTDPAQGDLTASLALVARANTGDVPVEFPAPLWSSELPARGVWYDKLRRGIADECCAPLYKYADLVLSQAKHQIALRRVQYWDSWLSTLETMGQRLCTGKQTGAIQATAGIRFQLRALEQREAIARIESGGTETETISALAARRQELAEALAKLDEFESHRDQRIAAARPAYTLPLELCWKTVALGFLAYLLTWTLGRVLRTDRTAWALPHAPMGIWALAGAGAAFFALLCTMSLLRPSGLQVTVVRLVWYFIVVVVFLFGMAYPKFALDKVARMIPPAVPLSALPEDLETSAPEADIAGRKRDAVPNPPSRWWYRRAFVSYGRRYYGILAGLVLCAISVWVILYWVVFSLYPFQVELLAPGLEGQEIQVVQQAISLLK